MYALLLILSVFSINCQFIVQSKLTKFSEVNSVQPGRSLCANSPASRSINVRSKAQCIFECQHGGDVSMCVGVNFRRIDSICEVYNKSPTSFTDLDAECQYIQRERKTPELATCLFLVGIPPYPIVPVSDCSFPFTDNGVVYYNCQPTVSGNCGYDTCLLSDRSIAICYPQADVLVNTLSTSLTVGALTPVVVLSVFNWIVIQQRLPTTGTAFEWGLNWASYRDGFGISGSNFWLGLERMHLLTSSAPYRLRVEVQQQSSKLWYSAEYSSFTVGDQLNSKYLLGVSGYLGDAGDALRVSGFFLHNGMKFSTADRDNEPCPLTNCAQMHGGGWWYNCCYQACTSCNDGHAIWQGPGGPLNADYNIQAARMMIKVNAG